MELNAQIKKYRTELNLSQEELADVNATLILDHSDTEKVYH